MLPRPHPHVGVACSTPSIPSYLLSWSFLVAVGECGNHEACSRLCDKNNDNCVCAEGYSSFGECKTIGELP